MLNRRGMTLIEMMIALIVFSLVLATSLSFISKQSKGFDKSASDMGMLQNLSFANQLLDQELRLAGANTPYKQPAVVYAGTTAFIYNADYASNTDSLYAVYYNPGLPNSQVSALQAADKFALPCTNPSFSYPDSNYWTNGSSTVNSPAETIEWCFSPDASTSDASDYVLVRQVNNNTPETVIRNIYQTSGKQFFRYYYKRIPASGASSATLDTVPAAWMPVKHTQFIHGSQADTGVAARVDSLAMVEVNFTVTNGLSGTSQRSRAINFMVPLPNNGIKQITSCGSPPLFTSAIAATWVPVSGDWELHLTWTPSLDENSGEKDVTGYVIWRRQVGMTTWGNPIASVPAGVSSPVYADTVTSGTSPAYQYAVAAQDCSPSLSTQQVVTAPVAHP
jgi:prepilin-type N-terminal cleavage/methylation domain-containing protein